MIANTIFAASALASLVAAIPLAQPPFPKRDVVWETHTEVAVTTIPVTVTHWLEPGETPPTVNKQHWGHHGHGHGHGHGYGQPSAQPETSETAAPAPSSYSPASTPVAPAASSYVAPAASSYEAPAPSSYVAPAASSSEAPAPSSYEQPTSQPAPVPSTSEAPAPAPTTEQATTPPAYTPAPSTSAAPEPSQPAGGSAPSGDEYSGDITHYDVGLGSCGTTNTDSEDVVAIPEGIMNNPANPNANPLCGQTITISYGGSEHTAKIVDTCGGCYATSIDLSPTLFSKVAPSGDGRVSDVKWWFNGA